MRIVMLALAFGFLMNACSKDKGCKNVSPADEAKVLEAYNAANAINATKHYTGLYYEIIKPGNTNKPTENSVVYVRYTGKKLDGAIFDSQTNPGLTGFNLNSLIDGWKVGIPLLGKGGQIKLTVPSGMAYGCLGKSDTAAAKNIPPNTPIYFDIELVDFLP